MIQFTMLRNFFWFIIAAFAFGSASGQIKAKAIAYAVEVDLQAFDPVYYELTDSEDPVVTLEVDVYYTNKHAKAIVRTLSKPIDYDHQFHSRYSDLTSQNRYSIDHENRLLLLTKPEAVHPTATGRSKKILGYRCKEYFFKSAAGTGLQVCVTKKIRENICPLGNFLLEGAVLEAITSNGLYYKATDFSEGVLAADFFELPESYKVIPVNTP